MKKLSYIFQSIFSACDFFKSNFSFTVSRNSSKTGSFISILILSLLLYTFFNSNMVKRINPAVINQNVAQSNRPKIAFHSKNFEFYFGLVDATLKICDIDPTIFTVSITQTSYKLNTTTLQRDKTIKEIPFHRCKPSDFPPDSKFFLSGIDNPYCLDDIDISTEGDITEMNWSYFSISLIVCNSQSNCRNQTEIQKYFQQKAFGVYYIDYNLDYQNYEIPITKFSRMEYIWCDPKVYKELKLYMKLGEFYDEKSIIDFGREPQKESFFVKDYSDKENSLLFSGVSNFTLVTIEFYSSEYLLQSQRIYQQLSEVLANLAGIANFLIFIGMMFMRFKNKIDLMSRFLNKMYDFQQEAKLKETMGKKKNGVAGINSLPKEAKSIPTKDFLKTLTINNDQTPDFIYISPRQNKEEEDPIPESLNTETKIVKTGNRNKLTITIFDYILMEIKRIFHLNLSWKERIIKKGEKEFKEMINIRNVLRKIQEVDKIKCALLNEKERLVMMLTKPKIALKDNPLDVNCKLFKQIKIRKKKKILQILSKYFHEKCKIKEMVKWEKSL